MQTSFCEGTLTLRMQIRWDTKRRKLTVYLNYLSERMKVHRFIRTNIILVPYVTLRYVTSYELADCFVNRIINIMQGRNYNDLLHTTLHHATWHLILPISLDVMNKQCYLTHVYMICMRFFVDFVFKFYFL